MIPALVRVRSFGQFNLIYNFPLICNLINSVYTRLFANLKRLGGGGGGQYPPPKLAISSQMMMKLGKDVLWVEIFTNCQKFMMTSSSC